jgi:hypothetical protein
MSQLPKSSGSSLSNHFVGGVVGLAVSSAAAWGLKSGVLTTALHDPIVQSMLGTMLGALTLAATFVLMRYRLRLVVERRDGKCERPRSEDSN